jgi:hypothetical protein
MEGSDPTATGVGMAVGSDGDQRKRQRRAMIGRAIERQGEARKGCSWGAG